MEAAVIDRPKAKVFEKEEMNQLLTLAERLSDELARERSA